MLAGDDRNGRIPTSRFPVRHFYCNPGNRKTNPILAFFLRSDREITEKYPPNRYITLHLQANLGGHLLHFLGEGVVGVAQAEDTTTGQL